MDIEPRGALTYEHEMMCNECQEIAEEWFPVGEYVAGINVGYYFGGSYTEVECFQFQFSDLTEMEYGDCSGEEIIFDGFTFTADKPFLGIQSFRDHFPDTYKVNLIQGSGLGS